MAKTDKEKVNFLRGSKEDYESLVEKDNNTIYFILDTQEIYVGDKLFSTIDFNDLIGIPYIPTEEEMQSIFNALLEKQPKEEGKGLSTNDFTNEFKTKLISLFNYNDSDIKSSINDLNANLEQEAEERAALGIALAEETQSREALDAALGEEIAAREALEIDLTNEINNRQAEDSKLNAALGQEAEKREALEAALLEEIQSRETLDTALNAETAARESLGTNLTNEINNRQIADSNLNANIEQINNKLFERDEKFRGFITLDDQEQINNYILSNEGRKNWADGEYAFAFLNDKINTGEEKFYQGIYRLTNNEVIQYIPDDHATQQWVEENYATKSDLANWRQYKIVSNIEDVLEPQTNIIYLVYNESYSSTDNVYDEYIWVNEKGIGNYWEHLGSTSINIQDYQKKLTAGDNITIDENNVISVTGDLSDYVKKTDYATETNSGVVKVKNDNGIQILSNGELAIIGANSNEIKNASTSLKTATTVKQHESVFYGLAKASGDITQATSDNPIGTYTAEAKASIQEMLGISELINNTVGNALGGSY